MMKIDDINSLNTFYTVLLTVLYNNQTKDSIPDINDFVKV